MSSARNSRVTAGKTQHPTDLELAERLSELLFVMSKSDGAVESGVLLELAVDLSSTLLDRVYKRPK